MGSGKTVGRGCVPGKLFDIMKNYEITVLSPVHIGTGKKITPFEYVTTKGKFIVIDLARVLHANPDRVKDLNTQLEQNASHFSLSDFLIPEEQMNKVFQKYEAALDEMTDTVLQDERHKAKDMDVSEHIKTPLAHQVYIPGSSLKGAFRTALAYIIFQDNESVFKELKDRLENVNWRWSDAAVNELIFWGGRSNPKYDLFKTLRFSDSSTLPANEKTLEVGKMKVLSLSSLRKKELPKQGTMFKQLEQLRAAMVSHAHSPMKPWWTLQEVLKPGITFTGNASVEEHLLRNSSAQKCLQWKAPYQTHFSLGYLIKAANTLAADICNWELHFFKQQVEGIEVTPAVDFYRHLKTRIRQAGETECYVCLGQGAGWHKITIGMLLERDQSFDFRKLRRELRLANNRLNFDFPKSRKLLMKSDDEIQSIPGWVKIQLE